MESVNFGISMLGVETTQEPEIGLFQITEECGHLQKGPKEIYTQASLPFSTTQARDQSTSQKAGHISSVVSETCGNESLTTLTSAVNYNETNETDNLFVTGPLSITATERPVYGFILPHQYASHYEISFCTLRSHYGELTCCRLSDARIIEVIKTGDACIVNNSADFSKIEKFVIDLWNSSGIHNPTYGCGTIDVIIQSLNCAEMLERRTRINPIRLRMFQLLLYQCYDQVTREVYHNRETLSSIDSVKKSETVAVDTLTKDVFGCKEGEPDLQTWKKRRKLLRKHGQIGKGWNSLVEHIGAGMLLICSDKLKIYMYVLSQT